MKSLLGRAMKKAIAGMLALIASSSVTYAAEPRFQTIWSSIGYYLENPSTSIFRFEAQANVADTQTGDM